MNYSSLKNIKLVCGYDNNSKVSDQTIRHFQNQATKMIDTYVRRRYSFDSNNLPANFVNSPAQSELGRIEEQLTKIWLELDFMKTVPYSRTKEQGNSASDRLKDIEKRLELIAKGFIPLLDNQGNTIGTKQVTGYPDTDNRIFYINDKY